MAWSTMPVMGASGCLTRVGENAYEPFDYLVDYVQRTRDSSDIPATFWTGLLAEQHSPDLSSIGAAAYYASQHDVSEMAFRRGADAGDATAMSGLGVLLDRAGRAEEAEQWYRRAADAGDADAMLNLGVLLADAGRAEEAEQWYPRAADADAMHSLGVLLERAGRAEEAEQWFRRAQRPEKTVRRKRA